jgi:YVTN family beta-propeller protein
VTVSENGEQFYVVNQNDNTLVEFDAKTLEITKTIRTDKMPESVVLSNDQQNAYVTNWFSNSLSVIDLQQAKQIQSIPLKDGPRSISSAQ